MLTAFHTTKRNPKSKALNAVLESVWVMPPSILHHNEVPQKGDKGENHSSAFRAAPCAVSAGGAILCPQPWGWDRQGISLPFPCCLSSSSHTPSTVHSLSSPLSLLQGAALLPSVDRTLQNFDVLTAALESALKKHKTPHCITEKCIFFSSMQAALCSASDDVLGF